MIAVCGYYMVRNHRNSQQVYLFASRQFGDVDLNRMQLAFGKAGLNEFEIDQKRISVPKSKRDQYLKALGENNAIPDLFEIDESPNLAFSQLYSREERLRQQQEQKKLRIRRMISHLDFVEQVWVEYDEIKTSGLNPTTNRTVALAVRARENQFLNKLQVKAISDIVRGVVAGLSDKDMVISDLNADVTFKSENFSTENQINGFAEQKFRNNELEQLIRKSLISFPELEIQIIASGNPSLGAAASTQNEIAAQVPTQQPISAGANQSIAVEALKPDKKDIVEKKIKATPIIVMVTVPKPAIMQMAGAEAGRSLESLESALEITKKQITQIVQPIIDTANPTETNKIMVVPAPALFADKKTKTGIRLTSQQWNAVRQWAQNNWPSLSLIGGGGLLIVLLIRKKKPARRSAEPNVNHSAPVTAANRPPAKSFANTVTATRQANTAQANTTQANTTQASAEQAKTSLSELPHDKMLRNDVAELIQQNPQKATEILSSWMKDAA